MPAAKCAVMTAKGATMTPERIKTIRERHDQIRRGLIPAQRVESTADGDIAELYGIVADLSEEIAELKARPK